MSISNLLVDNKFDLFCKSIDSETFILGGTSLPPIADLITRTAANVLTANTLIAGDGTNVVKDTLISVANNDMDIPAGKAYKINNVSVISEAAGVNTVSAHVMTSVSVAATTLKASQYQGTGPDSSITFNVGTGAILFDDMGNGKLKVSSVNDTVYPLVVGNNTDSRVVVLGTYYNGVSHCPSIGSNTSTFSAWTPLYCQTSGDSTPFIVGAASEATVIATGSKLYVAGNATLTGDLNCANLLATSNMQLGKNGANYHAITSTIAPAAQYTHTMSEESGTLAHTKNMCIYNKGGATPFVTEVEFLLVDAGISKIQAMGIIDIGTTMTVTLTNMVTAAPIMQIVMIGTGAESFGTSTTVLNIPAGLVYASVDFARTGGAGLFDLHVFRVFGAS